MLVGRDREQTGHEVPNHVDLIQKEIRKFGGRTRARTWDPLIKRADYRPIENAGNLSINGQYDENQQISFIEKSDMQRHPMPSIDKQMIASHGVV